MKFVPVLVLIGSLVNAGCNDAPEVAARQSKKDSEQETGLTKKSPKKTKETNSQSKKKCFGLVNGQDTEQYLPSVYLGRKVGTNGFEECSGTWIGPNALITAGHCINAANPKNIGYISNKKLSQTELLPAVNNAIFPENVFHHGTGYIGTSMNLTSEAVFSRDIAILVFKDNLADEAYPVGTIRPAVGSSVRLLGWGSKVANTNSTAPNKIRQTGTSTTINTSSAGFSALAIGSTSTHTAPGDSGGSLIFNNQLVGVTSGYYTFSGGTYYTYADLALADNKSLIAAAVAGGALIGPVVKPTEVATDPPVQDPVVKQPADDDVTATNPDDTITEENSTDSNADEDMDEC